MIRCLGLQCHSDASCDCWTDERRRRTPIGSADLLMCGGPSPASWETGMLAHPRWAACGKRAAREGQRSSKTAAGGVARASCARIRHPGIGRLRGVRRCRHDLEHTAGRSKRSKCLSRRALHRSRQPIVRPPTTDTTIAHARRGAWTGDPIGQFAEQIKRLVVRPLSGRVAFAAALLLVARDYKGGDILDKTARNENLQSSRRSKPPRLAAGTPQVRRRRRWRGLVSST